MTPLRIAVADDEPDMRDYFRRSLARLGHEVVAAAATGRELIEQCRQHGPDLVITDLHMPDMDGLAAAAELHRDGPVPVILVSAALAPDERARVEADAWLGYLAKPIKYVDLEQAVGRVAAGPRPAPDTRDD